MSHVSTTPPPITSDAHPLQRWLGWALVIITLLVYTSSLGGQFILDDEPHILKNERIENLWDVRSIYEAFPSRPLVSWTLAVNYAISQHDPLSYHVFNMIVHALAGLGLFFVLRATFQLPRMPDALQRQASWIAFVIALIWCVHPLNTQAVTYVIQRGESMMGMFYFWTLYCVIRVAQSEQRVRWTFAAWLCCALGLVSKEVMFTAPLVILLYDQLLLAQGWKNLLRRRWRLYAGFALLLLAASQTSALGALTAPGSSAGFGVQLVTPWQYLMSEASVLLHYLRLTVWPHPLCFDYMWLPVLSWRSAAIPGLIVLTILIVSIWGYAKSKPLSLAAVWFFLILAPTSSIMPIYDLAVEHRMYLPSAAAVTVVVLSFWCALHQLRAKGRLRFDTFQRLRIALPALVVIAASSLTVSRNLEYHDPLQLWLSTAEVAKWNPRALHNVGVILKERGDIAGAMEYYRRELEMAPTFADGHNNLGAILLDQGHYAEAIWRISKAAELRPEDPEIRYNLGRAFMAGGQLELAREHLLKAIELRPRYARAHNNLGVVYLKMNQPEQAIAELARAIAADPESAEPLSNLGAALVQLGRVQEAIAPLAQAVALEPQRTQYHLQLGRALVQAGSLDQAVTVFAHGVEQASQPGPLLLGLGGALVQLGEVEQAVGALQQAMEIMPGEPEPMRALAWIYATHEAISQSHRMQAVRLAEAANAATFNELPAFLDTLAAACARAGQFDRAIAIAMRAADVLRQYNAEGHEQVMQRIEAYRQQQPWHDQNSLGLEIPDALNRAILQASFDAQAQPPAAQP